MRAENKGKVMVRGVTPSHETRKLKAIKIKADEKRMKRTERKEERDAQAE